MVSLRSRRLENLFGASLDALTSQHVQELVINGVQEAFDLDFKAETYGGGDSAKREFAKDVAALANTAGGALVIGVAEDDQARAAKLSGADITDDELRRLRQIIASLVSPMPTLDLVPISDERLGDGRGYLLVAVPRSLGAPHAVLVNNDLRYPKRNGTTIRYLAEPEVAAAYRDRFYAAGQQRDRILEVEQDARTRLRVEDGPWVLVSLVPDLPGEFTVSTARYGELQATMIGRSPGVVVNGTTFRRLSVGQRCFLADDTIRQSPQAYATSLQMHTDGSGAYAQLLHDMQRHQVSSAEESLHLISDEWLVMSVLTGLLRLGEHARDRAGAGGSALARVQLIPAATDRPVAICSTRSSFLDALGTGLGVSLPVRPAELSAALDDLADVGAGLIAAAARLSDEIGQAFGVTEFDQLSLDGELRPAGWSPQRWRQQMVNWAENHGIALAGAGTTVTAG